MADDFLQLKTDKEILVCTPAGFVPEVEENRGSPSSLPPYFCAVPALCNLGVSADLTLSPDPHGWFIAIRFSLASLDEVGQNMLNFS